MIGEMIKDLRIKSNMTQSEFAEKMEVSQRTIANWEGENREPSINAINRIADFFGVSVDYLFGKNSERLILTENESKLLERFRETDDEGREIILAKALEEKRRATAYRQETAENVG